MKKFIIGLLLSLLAAGLFLWVDSRGRQEVNSQIEGPRLPETNLNSRAANQVKARFSLTPPVKTDRQILFGDLHVHSTYSMDAFLWAMPLNNGAGLRPPADACDYARYCSQLDFWSMNDHAESLTPKHWQDIRDTVQQCNATAGDAENPDLVTYLGWEWTQVGSTPENHYGHKNVIFRQDGDETTPARPIASLSITSKGMRQTNVVPLWQRMVSPWLFTGERDYLQDFYAKQHDLAAVPACADDKPMRALPDDCIDFASTPRELFDKLDDWGFDSLVIPHGNTWGFYSPGNISWDKQLTREQHDPERQRLIEIYSGHGNSEEYRDFRAVAYDADGNASCPLPSDNYEPCCHRAGEIIRARCDDPGSEGCQAAVITARQNYVDAGQAGQLTVGGVEPEEWLDCGQCRDCYAPSFNYRPGGSTQYALALSNPAEPTADGDPLRFRFGVIASSDNHSAKPGTGYKEYDRLNTTEGNGAADPLMKEQFTDRFKLAEPQADSRSFNINNHPISPFQYFETERQSSFFMTGGLVAVHSAGRDRDSIWNAMHARQTYGTSGDRILLWFDLVNAADGEPKPMGSEVKLSSNPRFKVSAVGAFEQKPGCPEDSLNGLSEARLQHLCGGECYNPSDKRKVITHIDIVRITPQIKAGEPVAPLIQDPWQRFSCSGDAAGCTVEFEDPQYRAGQREVLYYARAVQAPSPAVNADPLRCEKDADGACVKANLCFGDFRTPTDDDCLSDTAERAWSSPIYVRP